MLGFLFPPLKKQEGSWQGAGGGASAPVGPGCKGLGKQASKKQVCVSVFLSLWIVELTKEKVTVS